MTQQEVEDMIYENIKRLREYRTKIKKKLGNVRYLNINYLIEEGEQLMYKIQTEEIFDFYNGINPKYETLVEKEKFEELINEIKETQFFIKSIK